MKGHFRKHSAPPIGRKQIFIMAVTLTHPGERKEALGDKGGRTREHRKGVMKGVIMERERGGMGKVCSLGVLRHLHLAM